jgi:transcription elongation factor GreA-like protein
MGAVMYKTQLTTDFERDCVLKTLPPLAYFIAEHIGSHKSFATMSKEEVIKIISVIISFYQSELSKGSTDIPF